jgi:hypothetical protein
LTRSWDPEDCLQIPLHHPGVSRDIPSLQESPGISPVPGIQRIVSRSLSTPPGVSRDLSSPQESPGISPVPGIQRTIQRFVSSFDSPSGIQKFVSIFDSPLGPPLDPREILEKFENGIQREYYSHTRGRESKREQTSDRRET